MPTVRQVAPDQAQTYYNDMLAAMRGNPAGAQVTLKSPQELQGLQMFRTEGGGGFSIAPDGDVVAVFGSPSEPGSGYAMLQAAVEAGGRKLDAFDTFLPDIYETVGFRPVARVKWNDEFAPKSIEHGGNAARDWDPAAFRKWQDGKPDVVLFVHDPSYRPGAVNRRELPTFDDWDAAAAIQEQVLQQLHGAAGTAQGAAAPPAGLLDAGQPPGAAGGLLEAGAPPQGGGPVGGLLD